METIEAKVEASSGHNSTIFYKSNFTSPILQVQFYKSNFTSPILKVQFYKSNFTCTILQVQFYKYNFTSTILQVQFYKYNFTLLAQPQSKCPLLVNTGQLEVGGAWISFFWMGVLFLKKSR
jgi:hypothetical protein